MTDERDREIGAMFARLKAEERRDAPSFQEVRARATRRHAARWTRVPVLATIAAAVALLVIGTLVRQDRTRPDVAFLDVDLRASTWSSPTDFLLTTPGSDLMRMVPAVGAPHDWTPIGTPGRASAPESTRS
jgi:hypothetical protein